MLVAVVPTVSPRVESIRAETAGMVFIKHLPETKHCWESLSQSRLWLSLANKTAELLLQFGDRQDKA